MIEDDEDPGADLRFERPSKAQDGHKKLNLTQPDFARLLGIPVGTLGKREHSPAPAVTRPVAPLLSLLRR
jgi:hypothetical protein